MRYGYCERCNARVPVQELDAFGLCDRCAHQASRNAATRSNNLTTCQGGTAKPNVQRIYDAFVAKYPDALLTGISVKDDGEQLLLYLDNKPMYYAAIDPLTNAIGLTSYAEVIAAEDAAKEAQREAEAAEALKAKRIKAANRAMVTGVIGILYGIICLILQPAGGVVALVGSIAALAGGSAESRGAVIFAGAAALLSVFLGFPSTVLFFVLAIVWFCLGADF